MHWCRSCQTHLISYFRHPLKVTTTANVDLITNSRALTGNFPCFLSVQDIQGVLITMEIASHNYHHNKIIISGILVYLSCNLMLRLMSPWQRKSAGYNDKTAYWSANGRTVKCCNQNPCCYCLNKINK